MDHVRYYGGHLLNQQNETQAFISEQVNLSDILQVIEII